MIANLKKIITQGNIRIAIIAITGFLLFVSNAYSQSKKLFDNDNFIQCQNQITIVNTGDLDMGNILKNTTRYYTSDNVIKFKITSTDDVYIKIYKNVSKNPNDGTQWDQTWKMGPSSGYENNFSNNRVHLKNSNNKTYYVTMTINSIFVPLSASSGAHKLNLTLTVDIDD